MKMVPENRCKKCRRKLKYHYTYTRLCHWCFSRALVPAHIPDEQVEKYRKERNAKV